MCARDTDPMTTRSRTAVTVLSVALLFFSVPHILEDFALGEPVKRGIAPPLIAFVVSFLLAIQAAALFWLGQRRPIGLWCHAVIGVVWPVAAGSAQLPELLAEGVYRSGAISAAYVIGVIVTGVTMAIVSVVALVGERSAR